MENPIMKPRRRTSETVSDVNRVGETFADFRLLKKLGQGGMGEVYLAEQISLKRKVAIKMLRGDITASESSVARFQAESTTIAKLSHANVVQAYMVGEHEGEHYLVLEYVEGVSLGEYLARKGALEVPLVLSIMRQVVSALQRASELGIVHRDIKPGNILLTRKAEAKVADFGLARCLSEEERVDLTRAGATVGTPLYMSPEQIEGKPLDSRSDIYSFGVTCYQMLTGQLPFDGSNAFEIATKHVREEPPALEKLRSDIPPALCRVIRKMMAKKPEARYASPRELLQDIARARQAQGNSTQSMSSLAVDTPNEATPTPSIVPIWKRPLWLAVGGVVTLGLLAFVVVGVAIAVAWSQRPAPIVVDPELRAVVTLPETKKALTPVADPAEALKPTVEQTLKDQSPKPGGVDACIDLATIYLDQQKTEEAEKLFKRMAERKAPSAYYFVGRLGLAVTDAIHGNDKASHAKFMELFDSKAKDNRKRILNEHLDKNPDFAAWVNEADTHNVRSGAATSSVPTTPRRPTFNFKSPFRKS
jgi:serine/threonine-protein kinase